MLITKGWNWPERQIHPWLNQPRKRPAVSRGRPVEVTEVVSLLPFAFGPVPCPNRPSTPTVPPGGPPALPSAVELPGFSPVATAAHPPAVTFFSGVNAPRRRRAGVFLHGARCASTPNFPLATFAPVMIAQPAHLTFLQPQRGCDLQPKVVELARLPWVRHENGSTPTGLRK